MANKNTLLGGTDWISTDKGSYADLNDTFDAAVAYAKSLEPFFTNSDLYTVYDAFLTEVSATNWAGDGVWSNTSTAGGVAGEMKLNVVGGVAGTETAYSKLIPSNRHIWCRVFFSAYSTDQSSNASGVLYIGNPTDGWTAIASIVIDGEPGGFTYASLLVVAKGSNVYDAYVGGYSVLATTLANGCQIQFVITGGTAGATTGMTMTVDDVRYSNHDI